MPNLLLVLLLVVIAFSLDKQLLQFQIIPSPRISAVFKSDKATPVPPIRVHNENGIVSWSISMQLGTSSSNSRSKGQADDVTATQVFDVFINLHELSRLPDDPLEYNSKVVQPLERLREVLDGMRTQITSTRIRMNTMAFSSSTANPSLSPNNMLSPRNQKKHDLLFATVQLPPDCVLKMSLNDRSLLDQTNTSPFFEIQFPVDSDDDDFTFNLRPMFSVPVERAFEYLKDLQPGNSIFQYTDDDRLILHIINAIDIEANCAVESDEARLLMYFLYSYFITVKLDDQGSLHPYLRMYFIHILKTAMGSLYDRIRPTIDEVKRLSKRFGIKKELVEKLGLQWTFEMMVSKMRGKQAVDQLLDFGQISSMGKHQYELEEISNDMAKGDIQSTYNPLLESVKKGKGDGEILFNVPMERIWMNISGSIPNRDPFREFDTFMGDSSLERYQDFDLIKFQLRSRNLYDVSKTFEDMHQIIRFAMTKYATWEVLSFERKGHFSFEHVFEFMREQERADVKASMKKTFGSKLMSLFTGGNGR